jgi:hypothetical protein
VCEADAQARVQDISGWIGVWGVNKHKKKSDEELGSPPSAAFLSGVMATEVAHPK